MKGRFVAELEPFLWLWLWLWRALKSLLSWLKRCSDWRYSSKRKAKLKLIDYHDKLTIAPDYRLHNL